MNRLSSLLMALMVWASPVSAATLFEQLGGVEGLTNITNDSVDIALADPRIKDSFADTNIPRFRGLLYAHLCELTGGPCRYEGRAMDRAHASLQLTNRDFNALAEDLQIAMERARVPFAVQNRLLAILAPLQREIVTR